VKIWIAFLLLSFVLGARAMRRGRNEKLVNVLSLCVLVAAAYYSYRWA
jgi:hypothetical protein